MLRNTILFGLILVCIVSAPNLLTAQTTNATVTGFVTDETKAVMPDVRVNVINVDTNTRSSARTNSDGIFTFPELPPGNYRIEVEKQGFKSIVKPDVVLHVQDVLAINFRMAVGSASETITVEAGGPLINTTDATVSTVVDRQFAENLPMNGRSFQSLIELTPGVVVTASNDHDSGQFSINGQRAAANYWMVDGVGANIGVSSSNFAGNGLGGALGSFSALGGTNSLVSIDAMQEFRIQTSTYAPEFGRTPGGQISIVTRSGTNQFHGTVFDYLRNDLFDANDWFADSVGSAKPKERQNDFGGTFSGPILKKTFFFFSYEGLRLRLPQTTLSTVPDASFTPGGTTDSRQNALLAMQPFLNAYPLPNPNSPEIFVPCDPATDTTCPPTGQKATGSAQFNASYSNPATLDAYSLRIDHKLNDKLALFGRYNYSPSENVLRGGGSFYALSVLKPARITTQTATVGATWLLSPAVTNDLRFNYSRVKADSSLTMDTFGGAVPLASLPIPSPFTSQDSQFLLEIVSLNIGGLLSAGRNAEQIQRQINIVDNLSVQRGSHSLKFGTDFRRLSPLTSSLSYTQLALFFDVQSAQMGNSPIGQVSASSGLTLLFHNLGVFAQDTWRIAPSLTLTYGLRWDVDFAPSSLNGPSIPSVTGYNPTDFSQLAIAPPGTPPFKTTYGNVAPRIGLAYQISRNQDWQTVVRSGFGVFYDLASSEIGNLLGAFPPFGATKPIFNSAFPYNSAQSSPPPIPAAGTLAELFASNPNLKLPYTLEWNFALEQALGSQQTISATYIGATGRRLLQTTVVSAPPTNPDLGAVGGGAFFVDNTATSDYNALELQFQRRLSHGLQALASYTWSHSIDTGSAGSTFYTSNAGVPGSNPNANRGPSDFDIRNSFTAGLTYDIPAPRTGAFLNAILRGWSVQNIIQARSSPPVDISDSNFQVFNSGIKADVRPDLVSGQPFYLYGSQFPGGKALNPAAFTDPPVDPATGNPLRQGNVPRNFLRGFGATQWDFAVHRDFPIHESLKLEFRAEMFNVLNHPNFGPPNGAWPAGFGVSSQTLSQYLNGGTPGASNSGGGAFNPLYQIGGPRSMQFALKLSF